jgi:hypothetical protein
MGSRFVVPHDGQAMIYLIAALVACLAVIAWQRSSLRTARELNAAYEERAAEQWQRLMADDKIISFAFALLHDERHKGKTGNQAAWQKARDEWDALVSGGPK